MDKLSGMLPFLALSALGVVNVVAIGAWRRAGPKCSERGASS